MKLYAFWYLMLFLSKLMPILHRLTGNNDKFEESNHFTKEVFDATALNHLVHLVVVKRCKNKDLLLIPTVTIWPCSCGLLQ